MTKDLRDFNAQVYEEDVQAGSLTSGLDANKSATPAVGDVYVATDVTKLYICFAVNVWTNASALYLLLAGGTMTGAIAMGNKKVTGLAAPTAAGDAARKAYVDTVDAKLDDSSVASPTRALGTIYQNGSKLRLVFIVVRVDGSGEVDTIWLQIGAASPPTTYIGGINLDYDSQVTLATLVGLIPASYYYRAVSDTGDADKLYWVEIDLF